MMRLRDWPARRIGLLWLAGCAAEALLFAVPMSFGEPPPPKPDSLAIDTGTAAAADSVPTVNLQQFLEGAGFTVTREPLPSGDTLVRIGRDSSFRVAEVRGDTTAIVDASPDVEQAFGVITTAFAASVHGLARLLLIAAAVLLPVPLLLASITLVWAVQRRRRRVETDAVPV
jgi:hypothetical protein